MTVASETAGCLWLNVTVTDILAFVPCISFADGTMPTPTCLPCLAFPLLSQSSQIRTGELGQMGGEPGGRQDRWSAGSSVPRLWQARWHGSGEAEYPPAYLLLRRASSLLIPLLSPSHKNKNAHSSLSRQLARKENYSLL